MFPGVSMACVFAMVSGTGPKQRISSFIPVCINIDMLKKKKKQYVHSTSEISSPG